ncbi:hypothetical protein APSETT445_000200 [Aspergillus pseudonomiae]
MDIGNAKIAGMTDDLRLSSSQYEWLLTAFYITYILFEWMTLMYRLVPPHIYISLCVCGWGLVACFQSLATSFGGLVLLRALLGVTEAAFGPGVPFYLSLFYKREELAFRNGLFISAAPLASSFASSLAWVIVKMSSNGPIAPWRTLFLVEGFPSVIVAVFAWILIPDSPGSAWFLGPRQRMVAEQRMEENKPNHHEPRRGKFNWKEVRATLADPKSYITAVNSMGYSSVTSQALSAPPFLFAFVIVLLTAYISDRNRKRSPYLIMHALLSSASYLIIALTGHFHAHLPATAHTTIRYLCVYPATAGFFSAITLIMTWTMDNRVAKEAKGASIAIMNVIGQCGPLLGTRLYPSVDGPWYVRGMATCSFFMVVVAVLAFVLRVMLLRARRKVEAEGVEIEMDGGEESEVLMDCVFVNVPIYNWNLPRGVATINEHRAPRHEAASITESEERSASEFLRVRQSPKHVLCLPDSPRSRVLLEHLLDHGGDDVTGAQAVHTDTVTAPFHCERTGQLNDSRLGGVVDRGGHALVGDEAAHASDEQDGALLLVVEHLAGGGGGGVKHSVVVNLHNFVHGGLGVLEGALEVVDSGCGDQTVQALVLAGDLSEHVVHFCVVADINSVVLQAAAVVGFCVLFRGHEVWVGVFEAVEAVD